MLAKKIFQRILLKGSLSRRSSLRPVKKTTQFIRKLKGVRPIVAVTAYDFLSARFVDEADPDLILVGDSLGNTCLGFESTIPVTVDMMLHHTAAVARAKPKALVIADVPFGVVNGNPDEAVKTCIRLIQEAGADGVKIEGGELIADFVSRLTLIGIPVLGHIGLLPQHVLQIGSYRKYGKEKGESETLLRDAQAIAQAGAFTIVGEMIASKTAKAIVDAIPVPLIGIGSGSDCDGQILVLTDILGMGLGNYPSFSKQYANIGLQIKSAVSQYVEEVKAKKFPE